MKKPKQLHNFYKSDAWQLARATKIISVDGKCERCGKLGKEVHHIKKLTIENYKDVSISLNQENLELLCKDCHNKEHGRFLKQQSQTFDEDGNLVV